jgi:hypothetical protein
MKELTELIYDIDENRKFLIAFSQPRKGFCYKCEVDDRRGKENIPVTSKARRVSISFWRNFEYRFLYPDKDEYKDRIVPVITSWTFACRSGYLVVCDGVSYSHKSWQPFFWEQSETGSDYLRLTYDNEITPFLPKIKEDITALIKDVPDFEEKEVPR